MYGVDANGDGRKDPYNPVDAICAAARYLKAAGGDDDLRTAIFAYNHADWYVDEVLLYANQYGKLPEDLVGSLTGLTEGDRFPVAADARYADDISEREALQALEARQGRSRQRRRRDLGSPTRRGINIYSREGAPVVAVNDGVITRDRQVQAARPLHRPPRRLRQPLHLRRSSASVSEVYPVPKPQQAHRQGLQARHARTPTTRPRTAREPDGQAGRLRQDRAPREHAEQRQPTRPAARRTAAVEHRGLARPPLRLPRAARTTPTAPDLTRPARLAAREEDARATSRFKGYFSDVLRLRPEDDGAAAAQGGLAR